MGVDGTDDIGFVNTEELRDAVISDLGDATSFASRRRSQEAMYRGARAVLGPLSARMGPVLNVSAVTSGTPPITILARPVLAGGSVQMDFQVASGTAAISYVLLSAPAATGPWTVATNATFSTLQAGTKFRVSTPQLGGTQAFFQVRSQ
jgi:hypothetical protein